MIDQIICGDCLVELKRLPDNSIDSLVTDPPAGIAFMGKGWDTDKGGRKQWIAWLTSVMEECYRVMKPGAHGLVWALPRTSHWTATALEDAGFEVRDKVYHCFGSGFPKSANIGKHLDRMAGEEREKVPATGGLHKNTNLNDDGWSKIGDDNPVMDSNDPVSPLAKQWDGWGTALKPAVEEWILVRKPVDGTIAGNVAKWGTGGLNIDGCRVEISIDDSNKRPNAKNHKGHGSSFGIMGDCKRSKNDLPDDGFHDSQGRYPSHLILDDSDEVTECFPMTKAGVAVGGKGKASSIYGTFLDRSGGDDVGFKDSGSASRYFKRIGSTDENEIYGIDEDGELVPLARGTKGYYTPDGEAYPPKPDIDYREWFANRDQAFKRIAYFPKASKRDRDEGLDDYELQAAGGMQGRHDGKFDGKITYSRNVHPTVKNTELLRYLIRLITPPNGIVLDPFGGSGSTGKAAVLEGMHYVLIEQSEEYCRIAERRVQSAVQQIGMGI
jgi:DNA modification methylase